MHRDSSAVERLSAKRCAECCGLAQIVDQGVAAEASTAFRPAAGREIAMRRIRGNPEFPELPAYQVCDGGPRDTHRDVGLPPRDVECANSNQQVNLELWVNFLERRQRRQDDLVRERLRSRQANQSARARIVAV